MISINVGGHEYDSWDALPEDIRAQLVAAGVDPGPDGRLDSVDLARAGGSVTPRTVVTGPGGAPLPRVVAGVLASIADALRPAAPVAPEQHERDVQSPGVPDDDVPDARVPADTEDTGTDNTDVDHTDVDDTDSDEVMGDPELATTGRSRRIPLLLGWLVIGATVLLVATVVVIGLSGI